MFMTLRLNLAYRVESYLGGRNASDSGHLINAVSAAHEHKGEKEQRKYWFAVGHVTSISSHCFTLSFLSFGVSYCYALKH